MADDIKIGIQVTGKQTVLGAAKAVKTLEGNVKTLSSAYATGRLDFETYNKGIEQLAKKTKRSQDELLKFGTAIRANEKATKQAADATKAEATAVKAYAQARREATEANARFNAKAKEATAVAKANTLEEERLKNKFVEGYTAMNIYSKEMNDLALARKKGLISTKEQTAAVAELNAQMKAGTGAFANAATGMQVVGKRANRTGMLAQQAGYQFGDFAVQVQSGTNFMVAAGQQATQLIGTFSMLAKSTRAIMAFSALGVLVPIITGLAAAFMRSSGSADTLLQSLDKLEETNNSLRTFGEAFGQNLVGNIEAIRESFGNLVADVYEAKLNQVQDKVASTFEGGFLSESFAASYTAIKPSQLSAFNQEQLNAQAQQELAIQEQINKITSQTISSKSQLNDLFSEAYDNLLASDAISEDGLNRLKEIAIQNGIVLGIEKDRADIGKQLLSHVDLYQKALDKRKESIAAFQEQLVAQSEVLALLETENQFTKDSSQYRAELVAQEVDRLNKLLGQKEITEKQAEAALALFEATLDVNDAIADSAKSATELANALKEAASAMSGLSSFGDSLDKALAVSLAKVQALKSGVDATIAGSIAGMRADLSGRVKQGLASGVPLATIMAEIDSSSSKISELEASETKRKALEEAAKKSKGGGSNVVNINEVIAARKEQIAQDRVLLGLSGEQQAAQKIYYGLLKQNEKADIQLTEVELKGAADAIAAYEEQNRVLEEAKAQQEEVASVIADNFGSAFMSIVDGTKSAKEAFKDMARSIIKQLFQILVVEKMVKSIKSFISPSVSAAEANGGAWQGGSKIQAYADGGVVGGPTYFPMAGGKTGLMGEAGPEAIMPLKRGANGKLGVQMEGNAGGDVVINQSFNFQANGDDSVKRIIQQQIPRITEATKAAVVDSKRRGGSFGRAF